MLDDQKKDRIELLPDKTTTGTKAPPSRKSFRDRIKKNYVWIIAAVMLLALVLSRSIDGIRRIVLGPERIEREITEFVDIVPVKLYAARRMDFKDTLPVMGRIKSFREIELRFQTQGVLESFNFREGERVLRGDIIASLDQREALLKLQYASLELEKAKTMYDLGGLDKVALDQKQLEYDSARHDFTKTNIYAPSDGRLGAAEVDPGSYVTPQDSIGKFLDASRVWAVFDVIEEDSPKVKMGQNVEVFLDAYPGEVFRGRVDTISPMIEGRTRSQKVQVELENRDGLLRSGMFARAVINTYEQRNALIIPSGAFRREDNQFFVYVVHPAERTAPEDEEREGFFARAEIGIIEKRSIGIGYLTHDMAEVSEGLEEGEMIIREIHQDFRDDDKVEIAEVQETLF